jgi:hypothetical protein
MAVTRNPMAGRHAVGQQMARPGSIRGGQSATARPITASTKNMTPKPGVLANQAETSLDLQRRLSGKAPQPFTNRGGAATLAAPAHSGFGSTGSPREGVQRYGGGNKHSVHSGTSLSAEDMAAVGYGPKDTRGSGPIISGYPTSGGKRQAGRPGNVNKETSAKDNARVRQRPGGF